MLDEKFNTYLNFNYMKGSTLKESGRHPDWSFWNH